MKLFHLFLLAAAAIGNSNLQAQDVGAGPNPAPNPDATLAYIHSAWDTLTRSMTDCHSLVDIKVTANPVLYLPAETPATPELAAVEQELKKAGFPPLAWYDALVELSRAPSGEMRPVELEKQMLIPQYSTSRLIDRLNTRWLRMSSK